MMRSISTITQHFYLQLRPKGVEHAAKLSIARVDHMIAPPTPHHASHSNHKAQIVDDAGRSGRFYRDFP